MALKFVVDSLDSVEEAHRSLYSVKDGKFVLGVEGAVDRARLDEFRTNNTALQKQVSDLTKQFEGVDPAKFRELAEQEQKIREKKLIEAGQVDQLVEERTAAMRGEHDKQLKAVARERDASKLQLESLVIDGALRDAAMKAGVAPTAVDDVLLRGRSTFKLVDGKAVAMDGDKALFGKDSNPLGVSEWMADLPERAPHLFPASTGSGAPKGGSAAGGGAKKSVTRSEFDALSAAEKMQTVKDKIAIVD